MRLKARRVTIVLPAGSTNFINPAESASPTDLPSSTTQNRCRCAG